MSGMSFFGKIKYVIQRLANRRQQREDEIFRRIVKEKMGEYEAKQKAAAQPKQSKFNVMDTLKDNQHQRVHNNTSSSQSSSSTPPPTAAQKRHMEKVHYSRIVLIYYLIVSMRVAVCAA